jgi:hypothetical protein
MQNTRQKIHASSLTVALDKLYDTKESYTHLLLPRRGSKQFHSMEQPSILFILRCGLRQSHCALDLDASAPRDYDSPFSAPTSCEYPATTTYARNQCTTPVSL